MNACSRSECGRSQQHGYSPPTKAIGCNKDVLKLLFVSFVLSCIRGQCGGRLALDVMGQVACKVSSLQRHGPFVLRSSIGCQPATHWHLKHEYSTFALFLPHVLAQHSFQCHQFVSSFSVQERAVQIGELPFGSWSREIQQRIIFFKRFVQTAA